MALTPERIVQELNCYIDDPQWGDHSKIPKAFLRAIISALAAPTPPQSSRDAVRDAVIEECANLADNYGREGDRTYKEFACETADEIAARIRALKPTPSPTAPTITEEMTDDACEAFWKYGGGVWVKGRTKDPNCHADIIRNFLAMRAALTAALQKVKS